MSTNGSMNKSLLFFFYHILSIFYLSINLAPTCSAQRLFNNSTSKNANKNEISSTPASYPSCDMTFAQLEKTTPDTAFSTCIFEDTNPTISEADKNHTSIITIAGVFERKCGLYIAGAMMAVEQLNLANDGKGVTIGYNKDHYVKFRLVSGLVGDVTQIGGKIKYKKKHMAMLGDLIETFDAQYILGSCRTYAEFDKPIAGKHKRMVLSLGGPQVFYQEDSNEHVFGVFVPVETYGDTALKALQLAHPEQSQRKNQKIRVIYNDDSGGQFHYRTCKAIANKALAEGFVDTVPIEFEPKGDDDGDGVENRKDDEFLYGLADRACGTEEGGDGNAIFICSPGHKEMDTLLERFRENGCRPSLLWSAIAGKDWSDENREKVPYLMTDDQWHPSMKYSDEFFESGAAMLESLEQKYGYRSHTLDGAVPTYTAIYIMYKNVWNYFKTHDTPDVESTFETNYESMRRSMLDLFLTETLFGPISFDQDRRNVGRASAGTQWLVPPGSDSSSKEFELMLVSPADQASVGVLYPAPSSLSCDAGSFLNSTLAMESPALLENTCNECPEDTFQPSRNTDLSCQACPQGSSTDGETGSETCIEFNENLIPQGLLTFGYVLVGIVFALSIGFGSWTVYYEGSRRSAGSTGVSPSTLPWVLCSIELNHSVVIGEHA